MGWLNLTAEIDGQEVPVMKHVSSNEYSLDARVEIKEGDALIFAGAAETVVSVKAHDDDSNQLVTTIVEEISEEEISEEEAEEDDDEQVSE